MALETEIVNTVRPGLNLKQARLNETTIDTFELVAAVAGKQIQIVRITMANSVADDITIKSGSDEIFTYPLGAGPGYSDGGTPEAPLYGGNIGGNITATNTITPDPLSIHVLYQLATP